MGTLTGVSEDGTIRPYCSNCGGTNLREFGWLDPGTRKATADWFVSRTETAADGEGVMKILPTLVAFDEESGEILAPADIGDDLFCLDCEAWRECDWRPFTPPGRRRT